jgi:hypothetical protein
MEDESLYSSIGAIGLESVKVLKTNFKNLDVGQINRLKASDELLENLLRSRAQEH